MSWIDAGKKIVEVGAPLLGLVIGGPAGAAVGTQISKLFGADPANPSELVSKIQADPDAATKLKQFELQNKFQIESLHYENLKNNLEAETVQTTADLNDVQEARKMEIQKDSWMPEFITIAIFLTLALSFLLFFIIKIPEENKRIIMCLLVLLGWLAMVCCRFWMGGSIPTLDDLKNLRGK